MVLHFIRSANFSHTRMILIKFGQGLYLIYLEAENIVSMCRVSLKNSFENKLCYRDNHSVQNKGMCKSVVSVLYCQCFSVPGINQEAL